MEHHYSNLVQKYLANNLTASEQMELAVLSRLYGPRQLLGGMIVINPFMLEEGMVEQEEVEDRSVQVQGEVDPEEAEVQQQGETMLICQQQVERDNFQGEEEEEEDDFEDEENTSIQKSPPDHEFSYLSLAYGVPPARNRQVFEELDSRISHWSSKFTPLPLPSGNGQVFEQLESRISTWNDDPVKPSPAARNRQMFGQLESRIAGVIPGKLSSRRCSDHFVYLLLLVFKLQSTAKSGGTA
jgi:hypothetical protein